jgi:antitoxin VapB
MALNIKNPDVIRLAHEISQETKENMTQTIFHALEEKLVRLKGRRRLKDLEEAILGISGRCAKLPNLDKRSADQILGYDTAGGFKTRGH